MKTKTNMDKKGVSPVIATVLLIVITVILGGLVFVWANGFFKEGSTKNGEPVENSCGLINFEAQYIADSKSIQINNKANIPLYGFQIKTSGSGSVDVKKTLEATLGLGESISIGVSDIGTLNAGDKIIVVPIILGERGVGSEQYTCPDSTGQSVSVT